MRDYAEQVKALRNNAEHFMTTDYEWSNAMVHLLMDAADAIEELLRKIGAKDSANEFGRKRIENLQAENEELLAKVPHWISVEERLPELNQEVFVYAVGQTDGFFGGNVITKCKRYIFKPFPSSEGFENWSSPWQYFHTDYRITHWMPLPKAPEPPEEDE